jgi:hypothetical protein
VDAALQVDPPADGPTSWFRDITDPTDGPKVRIDYLFFYSDGAEKLYSVRLGPIPPLQLPRLLEVGSVYGKRMTVPAELKKNLPSNSWASLAATGSPVQWDTPSQATSISRSACTVLSTCSCEAGPKCVPPMTM